MNKPSHSEIGREAAPKAPRRFGRIVQAADAFYDTGLQPGVALVIRHRGREVLRYAKGDARGFKDPGTPRQAMRTDTPVCLFSASKAVTAMLVHRMAEEGRLRLGDRVSDYLPEFGVHGKRRTTILDLLTHRAGIPRLPARHADPELLFDWRRALELICAARPLRGPGRQQAYHAITAGYVLGEIVQRVSGQDLREVLQSRFARPLRLKTFSYGLPAAQRAVAAENAFTGPRLPPPLSTIAARILGVPFERVAELSNDPRFFTALIPAGNLYASAEDACRFFQMLLNGGELDGVRVLSPATVAAAIAPVGHLRIDSTLFVPVRFSAGMVLGEWPFGLYGRHCAEAFGHLGFINIICWADPARDIAVALLNTGKHMAPHGIYRLARLQGAISASFQRHG